MHDAHATFRINRLPGETTDGAGRGPNFSGHFAVGFKSQLPGGRTASIPGLPHTGMAPIRRKQRTDFGSPWQGNCQAVNNQMMRASEGTAVAPGRGQRRATGSRVVRGQ